MTLSRVDAQPFSLEIKGTINWSLYRQRLKNREIDQSNSPPCFQSCFVLNDRIWLARFSAWFYLFSCSSFFVEHIFFASGCRDADLSYFERFSSFIILNQVCAALRFHFFWGLKGSDNEQSSTWFDTKRKIKTEFEDLTKLEKRKRRI